MSGEHYDDIEAVAAERPPEQEAPEQEAHEQAAAPPAAEPKTMAVAGVTLSETQFPLSVVLVASIVLMIALGAHYDWKNTGVSSYSAYTISVAAIAMILSFFGLLLAKFKEDLYDKAGKHVNMLCFSYSFIGACFLTFKEPFTYTSNGYFAAWVLVYGSAMTLGMKGNAFGSSVKGLGAVMGLLASSVVVIVATITPIRDDIYKSEAVYALVLACVTSTFVLLVLAMDKKGGSMHHMTYFGALAILAICWIVEACLVTFRGPFEATGNGYFASWAAAATCSMAAFAAK